MLFDYYIIQDSSKGKTVVLLLITVIIFLLTLIHERLLLNSRIQSIPLRISVTGTRGKSSVARLLASILREDGWKVLAKTTGSEARLILTDGEEIPLSRRGIPSILEQKKLIKFAKNVNADCVVSEIMSIHPENHFVESQQILKPNIVIVTNIRRDHIDAMGKTEDEIASVLSLDIPEKARVYIPEKENRQIFQTAVHNGKGELIIVPEGISSPLQQLAPELKRTEFSDNLDIVVSLAKHLNIDQRVIYNGIRNTKHDIGTFKIWEYCARETQKTCYLVNGFAANDPESTKRLISKTKEVLPSASDKLTGLLSLRPDRGDRTVQWINALQDRSFDCFSRIYVTGTHSKIIKRKLKFAYILKYKPPEKMTDMIVTDLEDQAVIFGFGNLVGMGRRLVDCWNTIGEAYGI